jgi:hypothetical protein
MRSRIDDQTLIRLAFIAFARKRKRRIPRPIPSGGYVHTQGNRANLHRRDGALLAVYRN